MLLDRGQARLQVLAPGLELGVGELGLGNGRGGRGGRSQGRARLEDLVRHAPVLLGLGLASPARFNVRTATTAGGGGKDSHECLRQSVAGGLAPRKRWAKRGCKG